jgi:hypothetical protein
MNFMKKLDIKLVIIIILIVVIGMIIFLPNTKNKIIKVETGKSQFLGSYEDKSTIPTILPISQFATCSFNRLNNVSFSFLDEKNEISLTPVGKEKPKINYDSSVESQPNIVSFSDLDTKNPKMVANMGQDDLVKIYEDEETIHMIEKATLDSGTAVIYTIFKKEGVAIWTKQYSFLGTPYGYMAMGYCK